jgi:hypothetical protein
MKKPIVAALLSALVFPGVGHIFLKKYGAGLCLFTSMSVALYFFILDVIKKVQPVIDQVKTGQLPLELNAISSALTHQNSQVQGQSNLILYMILLLWIVAILDAYRLGRKAL